jgi:hypothetical protein
MDLLSSEAARVFITKELLAMMGENHILFGPTLKQSK